MKAVGVTIFSEVHLNGCTTVSAQKWVLWGLVLVRGVHRRLLMWAWPLEVLQLPPRPLSSRARREGPLSVLQDCLKGSSVSARTGKNPGINMLTLDGIFVATRFMVALPLPLLTLLCPLPLPPSNH